ncbi:hypothetical protein O181_099131 [Austropuccinia psidii MF-1]|uniref:Uncharacterized protein n=1 Tax=Austropuccinia psidii MF-1 TaxID=1389203 RepID=A0A9Q3PGK0_9BASI|nr:hypothetical protein [Austropuccinia psidii MF-1]
MPSTAHIPWETLGPFWPSSNEAKRKQGGIPAAPKPQVGPPETILAINPRHLKMAKIPKSPNFGQEAQETQNGHIPEDSSHGLWQSPEATRNIK